MGFLDELIEQAQGLGGRALRGGEILGNQMLGPRGTSLDLIAQRQMQDQMRKQRAAAFITAMMAHRNQSGSFQPFNPNVRLDPTQVRDMREPLSFAPFPLPTIRFEDNSWMLEDTNPLRNF